MFQPYISWKHKFSDELVLTAVANKLISKFWGRFFLPNRACWLGLKWSINDKSSFSFGLGYHSQTQPLYTRYYINEGNNEAHNENLGLILQQAYYFGLFASDS